MPEPTSSPQQIFIAALVALGALTALRELLALADRARLATALDADPGGPARAAESILDLDLHEREERSNDDGDQSDG